MAYNPQFYQPQTPLYYQQPQPQPPITNKIYVTSAEDALSRFASPNTITVYFLQDESTIFEVSTDIQGKKNIRTLKLSDVAPQKPAVAPSLDNFITRDEFDAFKGKLEGILQPPKAIRKTTEGDK